MTTSTPPAEKLGTDLIPVRRDLVQQLRDFLDEAPGKITRKAANALEAAIAAFDEPAAEQEGGNGSRAE